DESSSEQDTNPTELENSEADQIAEDNTAEVEDNNSDSAQVEEDENLAAAESNSADPYLDRAKANNKYQYQFDLVKALDAWDKLTDVTKPTTVAVIDTGVDPEHEDLQANLVESIRSSGKYTQFAHGNQIEASSDSDTDGGHGTHCAGAIGATYNNGLGGAGIAAGRNNELVRILSVGASPDGSALYDFDIVQAVDYAVDKGADVISMSFGIEGRDYYVAKTMRKAYESGVVLVASSGNSASKEFSTPAYLPEVIGVNACDDHMSSAYYSNAGIETDVTAPGSAIPSTSPGDKYILMSGTSMATPIASAVCALILDANPNLTPKQVYNILCATASNNGEFKENSGYGVVDASAAVDAAKNTTTHASKVLPKVEDTVTLEKGDSTGLECLVMPNNWVGTLNWSSDSDSIAKVDQYGVVTGVAAGTTNITATASGQTATWKVEVKEAAGAEKIELSIPEENWILPEGVAVDISKYTKFTPSSTEEEDIYVDSIEGGDVVFPAYKGYIYALKEGSARIRVFTRNGIDESNDGSTDLSRIVNITVKKMPNKIKLKASTYSLIKGKSTTVAPSFDVPASEVANPDHLVWSVGSKKIASVDQNGKVKAISSGKTYVKCEYKDEIVGGDLNPESGVMGKTQIAVWDKSYTSAKSYGFKKKSSAKKSVTLSWKKVSGADGYKIYRASSKNGSYKVVKTIKKGSTTSVKLTTKKAGYYKIRAYMSMDNKTTVYASQLAKMTGVYAKPKK
ncbi:MAG: S8 family serine peptidase, partial [Bacillota bacterium]|nr:S8 family serine peptidase [Bacillota bacterium]